MSRWTGPLAFAAGYLIAAVAGQWVSADACHFGERWAAAGVLFAALWLAEPRNWLYYGVPAVVLTLTLTPPPEGFPFATGNLLEGAVAAILARAWIGPPRELLTVRGTARLGLVVAPLAAAIGAAAAVPMRAGSWAWAWPREWVGDWVGLACIAPWVVLPATYPLDQILWLPPGRRLEFFLCAVVFGAASVALLGLPAESVLSQTYPILSLMLWSAVRYGPYSVATGIVLHSLVAVGFGSRGTGPLAPSDLPPAGRAIAVQFYLLTTGITYQVIAVVIHELRLREYQLRFSEAHLRAFLDHAPLAAWVVDAAGRLQFVNRYFTNLTGLRPETVLGKSTADLYPPEVAEQHTANNQYVRANARPIETTEDFTRADGTPGTAIVVKFPLGDATLPDHVAGVALDVTDRHAALRELRDRERRFRGVFNAHYQFIGLLWPDGRVIEINDAALRAGGLNRDDVIGRHLWDTGWWADSSDARMKLYASVQRAAAGEFIQYEATLRGAEGEPRLFDFLIKPLTNDQGQIDMLVPQGRDITAGKAAERQLRDALAEKETLLREVHHRVKNNLAVISSLLGLQARERRDPALADALRDSADRVAAMAAVHEMLYSQHQLAALDWPAYIERLAQNLRRSYSGVGGRVRIETRAEPMELPFDAAVPVGLILNEMISNALKHAFPDGRGGTVTVTVGPSGTGFRLSVADDGIGLPVDFDAGTVKSLGLRLMRDLANQIGGTLELSRARGTVATVCFSPSLPGASQ